MRSQRWNPLLPVGLMCLLGAALSVVLIAQHAGESTGLCPADDGNCSSVLSSRWGVFPPADSDAAARSGVPLGAIGFGYFSLLAGWLLLSGPLQGANRYWHLAPLLAALGGTAASVWLLGVMWQLGDWCPLCLTVHGLNLMVAVSLICSWPRPSEAEDAADVPSEPLGRLALSVGCLAIFATLAGTFYSRQLLLGHENRELTQRLDQLLQDNDVVGRAFAHENVHAVPVRSDDPGLGADDAVANSTLVVFSDAFCQHCQAFKDRLQTEILPAFNGRLRVVYKHFPLCGDCNTGSANVHPLACEAAYLMEAARLQGGSEAFEKLSNLLHGPRSTAWTDADVTAIAQQAGLDAARLLQDRTRPEVHARVADDAAAGRALGVRGIPAIFLNGREVARELRDSPAFWQMAAQGKLLKNEPLASQSPTVVARAEPRQAPQHSTVDGVKQPPAAEVSLAQQAAEQGADSILKDNDVNENGQLDAAEWTAMSFNPKPYDKDDNGIVTRDELIASVISVNDGQSTAQNPAASKPAQPQPRLSSIGLGDELQLAGPTLANGDFELSAYRGKVVVVDFWASWCGFCVEETAYLQRLYEKYHDQGLEIVGVSADETRADLERFVTDNHLPWTQIYFDEDGKRGRENPALRAHAIRGLPQLYVVDREGKVTALLARRHQVEAEVTKLLGVAPSPVDQAEAEVKLLAQRLVRPEKVKSPAAPSVAVGSKLEIAGKTIEGQDFDVRTWRGKPVLVVYWASWCPHCKKELPNLHEAYRRHHADGLEIVGISVDKKLDDLQKYLTANPQPWPTLYRDEDGYRGFDNPLVWQHGVHGVPALFLLDGDGKVVHLKPRGPQLELEVAKLLGKEPVTSPDATQPQPVASKPAVPKSDPLPSTNPLDYDDAELAQGVVQRYDTNGDGVLQTEEWQKMPREGAGFDKNGDGLVTVEEFASIVKAAKNSPTARNAVLPTEKTQPAAQQTTPKKFSARDFAAQVLKKFDKNSSGLLEQAEWSELPGGKPELFDLDKNGEISLTELTKSITAARAPPQTADDGDAANSPTP